MYLLKAFILIFSIRHFLINIAEHLSKVNMEPGPKVSSWMYKCVSLANAVFAIGKLERYNHSISQPVFHNQAMSDL